MTLEMSGVNQMFKRNERNEKVLALSSEEQKTQLTYNSIGFIRSVFLGLNFQIDTISIKGIHFNLKGIVKADLDWNQNPKILNLYTQRDNQVFQVDEKLDVDLLINTIRKMWDNMATKPVKTANDISF
jgi:hypothetical protein